MDNKHIKVLLIEDNPGDARLIRETLAEVRSTPFDLERADRLSTGLKRLAAGGIDVVLLDLSLPDSQRFDTFTKAHAQAPEVPIVMLTGLDDEALAVKAVRGGAQDYLVKGHVDSNLLARAMRYAIERKRMEEELRKHTEHLEELVEERTRELREAERMAAIGEAAGMVGHDLRNPLQAVVNTLYLAKEKLESMTSPERQGVKELLKTLEEQVEYMNKIVSDLQDYAGPVKPEPVPTSLPQLINETLSTIEVPETIKTFIEIEGDLDFPKLMVDPALMRRLFTNLVTNALQAMPDGGQLTIRSSKTGEAAFISVRDTGVGIPKEDLPKLFHPLFTTKSKGQGFGLPVCRRLVEAHDGSITVESKVGRGTTFTVKIPLRREVS